MDSSKTQRCVIPLVIVEDAAKSTRGDFRTMVDHNVERLVRAVEHSEHGSQVRLLTVHYHDEITVKSHFAPLRDILPCGLELSECRGTARTGGAMLFAMEELQRQREAWKAEKTGFTRAVFLLLTDDRPVDWPQELEAELEEDYRKAARRVRALAAEGQHSVAGCALSQLRMIRCNEKKLRELCERIFAVQQLPDGVEHMEEGFSQVVSWVKAEIADAWAARPRMEEPEPREEASDRRPEWEREEYEPGPAPAADDPIRRFLGILDEGKNST